MSNERAQLPVHADEIIKLEMRIIQYMDRTISKEITLTGARSIKTNEAYSKSYKELQTSLHYETAKNMR